MSLEGLRITGFFRSQLSNTLRLKFFTLLKQPLKILICLAGEVAASLYNIKRALQEMRNR